MGSNTTNYNLYKPAVGETGWGAAVNSSTDTVDTTMKLNADGVAGVPANTAHRTSDGKDHSDVVTNNAKISYTDAADVGSNTTHRTSDGKDHSDVVTNNAKISYTDAAAVGSNTTHRTSDGSDHSFLDQSVVSGATPTFGADNLSDGGGNAIITTTQETNFETAYTHASSSGSDHSLVNSSLVSTINFIIDGGGAAIDTGIKGDIEIPFACTINQVTLLADQAATSVIDIWGEDYANFPPTDADTITSATPPTITAALKSQDSTLTSWTTSITAGDILRFNVDSNDVAERITISIKVTKT